MISKSFNLVVRDKIKKFKKSINVDSDKSISIRSFLIGSICENVSSAKNVLESEDVKSTILCLKKLGVKIVKKTLGIILFTVKVLDLYTLRKIQS